MSKTQQTISIVGGGLAGIAAADAARTQGYSASLFERSGVLGGRVASLFEPYKKQWIDIGQHLFLGCCSEVLDLHRRLGLERFFDQSDAIFFANLKQQRWSLTPLSLLPKCWQVIPSFCLMPALSIKDRLRTGLLLNKIAKTTLPDISIAQWFKQHHIPQSAMDAFWQPLILSALSEMPDYASVKALQRVIQDGFLTGKAGMTLYIPAVPLRQIYHEAASNALIKQGVLLHFHKRLQRLHWERGGNGLTITGLEFSDGSIEHFDRYILAMPAFQLWKVLDASELSCRAEHLGLERFEPGAISTVHLWLDRPVLRPGVRHCALSGGIGQFLFQPNPGTDECYYTVVISAAHRLLTDREMTAAGSVDLAGRVLEQLRASFGLPDLHLRHCRTTTCFEAVFSPEPAVYGERPAAFGLFSNGSIAGDWTQTGLPSTMEGSVRSGLAAVRDPR